MLLIFPLLAVLSLALLFFLLNPKRNEPFHPPPGPKGLPIIGNLHQFDASKPHLYFAELAKIYGPIISLRLGNIPVVVVQSAKLAKEVLQTQDLNFCSRPSLVGMQRLSYNGLDIAFAPYNEYFREMRKLSAVHLFSLKRVELFAPIRQEEALRMMNKISSLSSTSEIVNLSELIMEFSNSNICRIAFGKRYGDDKWPRKRYHSLLNEAEAMFTTFFFTDYFPSIGWLDKLTGKFSRLEMIFKELDAFYEEIINDHLDPNKPKAEDEEEDIIDVLLKLRQQHPSFDLTFDHIKALIMDILLAGTDTSAAMIVWAMTELMKHPRSMTRVQQELRNALQNKEYISNGDLKDLEYFKAVVKETFRLHPSSPLLVVHETIHKSTIEGYDIRPQTLVYVNVWTIGKDPVSWKDPDKFMPERFLESSIDFKGCDFELIPFGAGRRICPALHLGVANVDLALANLLHFFDWELPHSLKKGEIDTTVLPGIVMHKKIPLCLMAKTKLSSKIKN